jgi:ribosomal protein S18 acetylase RimI-like enzyme
VTPLRVVAADLGDPSHRQAIVAVLDSYARDPMGGGTPLSPEVSATLADRLQAHPTTRAFLAFDGDEPVGLAICFLGFSTFAARPLLNVHDLAVSPQRRGRGIGRMLLAAVEDAARAEGCCKLTLEVLDSNDRARGLYASFGFDDYALQGSVSPTRFLTKSLDP